MEAALIEQRANDERMSDEMIAQERQHFASEITKLRDAWVCFHCHKLTTVHLLQLSRNDVSTCVCLFVYLLISRITRKITVDFYETWGIGI